MDIDFVPCPKCRKRVEIGAAHFPFCSERCRLLDLGSWFAEDYRLSRSVSESFPEEVSHLEGEPGYEGEPDDDLC